MGFTINQLLEATARRLPKKTAVVAPDRTLTFEQLDQWSTRVALRLRSSGIEPGHRVTLWMENSWLWMAAYYGVLKCGAVINPCNGALTADEIVFIAGDCGARAVILGKQRMDELRGRVSVPLLTDFDDSPATEWRPVSEIDVSSTSTISYTSGTTGRPKGAALSHITVVGNTLMTALMHGRSQSDIVVSALPCTHVYGNIVMNSAVACGATLVLFPRFDELAVLHSIEACRATMFEGVPTMFLRLLNCPEFDSFDLSSLRICTVGGQSMPVARMQEVERRFGCPLIELWGMTELGGLAATHWHNGPRRLGSIGVPLPMTEIKVASLDSPAAESPRGEVGELLIRGPLVMQGYWGDDAATRAAVESDGWMHTGDVVRQDSDGYLYLVDRIKEMIVSGGYNVYPAEVERVIAKHPAVAMVAVAPMRSELKGEVPKAFVVLRADVACSDQEIIEHCRKQLAAYKVPRAVQFLTDLPKTSTGKILRRALAQSNTQ